MSLVKSKAIQLGFDATPTNNFLIYQPLTPDGTFRIANGNQGATTDIMTVTSGGSVTFAGTTNFSSLNFGAGSQTAPSLFPTGDSNTGIYFPVADTVGITTNGVEKVRVDAAGHIGLGITPSSWVSSDYKAIQLGAGGASIYGGNSAGFSPITLVSNAYVSGASTAYTYLSNNTAGYYRIQGNVHTWGAAGASTGTVAFTTPMLLDANGSLLLGTSSGSTASTTIKLSAYATPPASGDANIRLVDNTGAIVQLMRSGSSYNYAGIGASESAVYTTSALNLVADGAYAIKLATGSTPTERMRITSSGVALFRTTDGTVYDTNSGGDVSGYWNLQTASANYTTHRAMLATDASGGYFGAASRNSSNKYIVNGYIGAIATSTTAGSENGALVFKVTSAGAAAAEKMRIDSAGVLSIATGGRLTIDSGSNSPIIDLTTSVNAWATRGIRMLAPSMTAGNGSALMYSVGQSDTSKNMGQMYFYYAGYASNSNRLSFGLHSVDDVLNIMANGNVGIGNVNPSAKLHVTGGIVGTTVATGDLIMSNMEQDPNEVDGTHGHWCLQEGEDNLYLINRRNGKKYKFNITEVV